MAAMRSTLRTHGGAAKTQPHPEHSTVSSFCVSGTHDAVGRTNRDVNIVTALNINGRSSVTRTTITEGAVSDQELTPEEIEAQDGEVLPDREAMSLIDGNVASPINAAAALNVLSENSVAGASATQDAPITQSN
ncbi:MAG TPA: hypothetical protein VM143_13030 [Acidimicrobiales bacterium]|nr:hypothetical protein [Acidimicrobiales bacterium]